MTDTEKVAAFIHMCPLIFLAHQIDHYTKRMAECESWSEFAFVVLTLYRLKKSLPKYYN